MQTSLVSPYRTKQKRRLRWKRASTQRYPGQLFDSESGLHYNYFRDYEAVTGRYVESDPIGLEGGISTYGYVAGNPLLYKDPLGKDYWVEGAVETERGYPLHQSICVGKRGTANRLCISFGVAENDCVMDCKGEVYIDISEEGPLAESRPSSPEEDSEIRVMMMVANGTPGRYWVLGNNCRHFSNRYFKMLNRKYSRSWLDRWL